MQKKLAYKIAAIGIMFLILQIPLMMVEGVIQDRTNFRNAARADIARSWTDAQGIIGPILVAPYLEKNTYQVWDAQLKANRNEERTTHKLMYLLPDTMHLNGSVQIEERQRGLYSVPVYTADLALDGTFSTQPLVDLLQNAENIKLEPAYLTISVSDLRGIVDQPHLTIKAGSSTEIKEKDIEFRSGSKAFNSLPGMNAIIGNLDNKIAQNLTFATHLSLRGMENIHVTAVAKDTQVTLKSLWQHPSFIGHYLPKDRHISSSGFDAFWQASSFSGDMDGSVQSCAQDNCSALLEDNFGVSFITPVDIYQQGERSVKYGVLFMGLTFIAFFLFEILKKMRLHAMHYLLVGLALATFYLLLVSFSEHFDFSISYLIATASCTTLLAFYISGIMRDWRLGLAFAGKFLILYGMLYVILQSEDNALLMGSLLIFVVLSLVMTITRNLDWYEVGEKIERIIPS